MRGMSIYCAEHYHHKEARAVTSEPWHQEQHHRCKFGDSDHDAKPVRVAPPVKIAYPKDVARHLQPTRSQADECEKKRDDPKRHFFHDSAFSHSCPVHIRLWNKSTKLLRAPHLTSEFVVDEVRDAPLFVSDKLSLAVKFFGKQFAFSIVSGKQLVSLTSSFTQ